MCQIRGINQTIDKFVLPAVVSTGLSAVVTGCAAGVLGVVNPVGGIIFGATAAAANTIAAGILSAWSNNDPARLNLSGFLLIPLYFASVAAATAITIAAGFPMTWVGVYVCACAVLTSYMMQVAFSSV